MLNGKRAMMIDAVAQSAFFACMQVMRGFSFACMQVMLGFGFACIQVMLGFSQQLARKIANEIVPVVACYPPNFKITG